MHYLGAQYRVLLLGLRSVVVHQAVNPWFWDLHSVPGPGSGHHVLKTYVTIFARDEYWDLQEKMRLKALAIHSFSEL